MNLAPVVLFAYNRPDYLLETLKSLQANEEARLTKLFIYCDGPKPDCSETVLKKIREVHAIAIKEKWCSEVNVIISNENKGLATSIIHGVTEIVNRYGKVIVMEDDLVVSRHFLSYMNTALNEYEHDEQVASITGYVFPIQLPAPPEFRETFFLKTISTLGWGVWKRSWALFNPDASYLLNKIKSRKMIRQFNFDNTYPYTNLIKKVIDGTVSSWGVRWYASVLLSDKLTLFPSFSLVNHIGNEGTNVRVDSTVFFGNSVHQLPISNFDSKIAENKVYRRLFAAHFSKYSRRKLNFRNLKYYFRRVLVLLKDIYKVGN